MLQYYVFALAQMRAKKIKLRLHYDPTVGSHMVIIDSLTETEYLYGLQFFIQLKN